LRERRWGSDGSAGGLVKSACSPQPTAAKRFHDGSPDTEGRLLLHRIKRTTALKLTARQDGSVKASGRKTLESVVEKAFGRRVERWFPKPVLALDLEVWLEEMKTGVGTMPQR